MALLTIAGGALLLGHYVMARETAITIAWILWILWILGTLGGLVTAIIIPYRLFTQA